MHWHIYSWLHFDRNVHSKRTESVSTKNYTYYYVNKTSSCRYGLTPTLFHRQVIPHAALAANDCDEPFKHLLMTNVQYTVKIPFLLYLTLFSDFFEELGKRKASDIGLLIINATFNYTANVIGFINWCNKTGKFPPNFRDFQNAKYFLFFLFWKCYMTPEPLVATFQTFWCMKTGCLICDLWV